MTGYLLREIQKANIAIPEEDESPLAPPPRQVLEIMASIISISYYYERAKISLCIRLYASYPGWIHIWLHQLHISMTDWLVIDQYLLTCRFLYRVYRFNS